MLSPRWLERSFRKIAETNRAPFDLPEAEAESVAGYKRLREEDSTVTCCFKSARGSLHQHHCTSHPDSSPLTLPTVSFCPACGAQVQPPADLLQIVQPLASAYGLAKHRDMVVGNRQSLHVSHHLQDISMQRYLLMQGCMCLVGLLVEDGWLKTQQVLQGYSKWFCMLFTLAGRGGVSKFSKTTLKRKTPY